MQITDIGFDYSLLERYYEEIGSRIKKSREILNITQQQLSDLSGVSKRTIQRTECGDTVPDTRTLISLEYAFYQKIGSIDSDARDVLIMREMIESAPDKLRKWSEFIENCLAIKEKNTEK